MAIRHKYFRVINKPNENDSKVFPVRLINLPNELIDNESDYSTDIFSIQPEGEIEPVTIFWCKKSSKLEFDSIKQSHKINSYSLFNNDEYIFYTIKDDIL